MAPLDSAIEAAAVKAAALPMNFLPPAGLLSALMRRVPKGRAAARDETVEM